MAGTDLLVMAFAGRFLVLPVCDLLGSCFFDLSWGQAGYEMLSVTVGKQGSEGSYPVGGQ